MSGHAEHELMELGVSPNTDYTQANVTFKSEHSHPTITQTDSFHDRDADTLAHLGKRQVLKVRSIHELVVGLDGSDRYATAQVRPYVNAELQLHSTGYMGRYSGVSGAQVA